MIPTFSGNSRRPRNVNLSGRNNNKLLSAWAPSSGFGTSDTIIKADEKRKQRQLEKKKLEAAQKVQRTWRGHRVRENLRYLRRDAFDRIYRQTFPSSSPIDDPAQRLLQGAPIICAAFQPSKQDLNRIVLLSHDIIAIGPEGLAELSPSLRLAVICEKVFASLRMFIPPQSQSCEATAVDDLLTALSVVTRAAGILSKLDLCKLYRLLADIDVYIDVNGPVRKSWVRAVETPLALQSSNPSSQEYARTAYEAFAFSFLCYESSPASRQTIQGISKTINISLLSSAIILAFSERSVNFTNDDRALWLAAHVIDIGLSAGYGLVRGEFMEALLLLVNSLYPRLTDSGPELPKQEDSDTDEASVINEVSKIPSYVNEKLESLTTQTAIDSLVQSFAIDSNSSSSDCFRITATLAGYMLSLFRCFPQRRDQISLRLFLSDINTRDGATPLLQHLLSVVLRTRVYLQVSSSKLEPLDALKAYLNPVNDQDETTIEWAVIILTLDLYSFVLRLTDDVDFFSRLSITNCQITPDTPRIQRCNLHMTEIVPFSQFLRDMSFPFFNNLAELGSEPPVAAPPEPRATPAWAKTKRLSVSSAPTSSGFVRLDLPSLKPIITTALTMIYERDSRRRFFPEGHWLMTAKFNMSAFLTDIVLEHERQSEQDEDEDEIEVEELPPHPTRSFVGHRRQMAQKEWRAEQLRRDRLRSMVAPRLEVLRHMPFVIPFETRVEAMRKFISVDMAKTTHGPINDTQIRQVLMFGDAGFQHGRDIEVVRGKVFESAFAQLWAVDADIKRTLRVSFVDQFGVAEAGIDGGGITKEFLIAITNEAFGELGLFTTNSHNQYYPDSSRYDWYLEKMRTATTPKEREQAETVLRDLLQRYEFLGRILGKCIYSGILIDVSFAPFFLLKCTTGMDQDSGFRNNINDLRDLDEQTYQGLVMLKNAKDASELELDFIVDDRAAIPGEAPIYITRKLIPNGDKVGVTNENRLLYSSYFARHRLVVQSQRISTAFLRGLWSVISPAWISMFNQWELQRVIGGDSEPVNLADWRANTEYSGIYVIGDDGEEHPVIKLFWEVMEEFSEDQKRAVLQFVTSVPRAPLLGFSQLNPRFAIRDSKLYADNYVMDRTPSETKAYRFPTSATCMNLFKLPPYQDKQVMRTRLLEAVSANNGFGLS